MENTTNKNNWFNFNGTISGGEYFLRSIINSIVGGIILGVGVAAEMWGLVIVMCIPVIILSLSTTNKRINAVMPESKALAWILALIPYVNWITSIVFLFMDAKRFDGENGKHNG